VELTNADVADILALLDSLPYDEFDLRTDRFRLTLRRTSPGTWTEERQVPSGSAPATPDAPDASTAPATSTASATLATTEADGLVAVLAPLPGTFYRAPRPGAAPFVEVGDVVTADTVVAIVETMKLMNSVPAGTPGRVARICLDNGEFAALGATVILIEPDA
jgi:acetyl-CoA carboxylase biotin carboxyl carrier protein